MADAVKPATAPEYEPSRYLSNNFQWSILQVVLLNLPGGALPLLNFLLQLNHRIASSTSTLPWGATSTVSTL
jgi:hypothetical protein